MTDAATPKRYCNIIARWWHRKLRRLDRQFLGPAIEEHAQARPESERGDLIRKAWTLHESMPSEWHWRCPCAEEEKSRGL